MSGESPVTALIKVIRGRLKKSAVAPVVIYTIAERENFAVVKKTSKVFFIQAAREALKNAKPLTYNNFRIELAQTTLARVSESLFI